MPALAGMGTSVFDDPMFTVYYLPEKSGFTAPPWPGFHAFIAAAYGAVIPNLATNEVRSSRKVKIYMVMFLLRRVGRV